MKVKSDHRSKFSSLSNWKEEAWKNQGFNGIPPRDLRDTGAMLYQLSYEATRWERGQFIEFIFSSFQLLKLENLLRWSLFTFIYYRGANVNYFIYTSQNGEKKKQTWLFLKLHIVSLPYITPLIAPLIIVLAI